MNEAVRQRLLFPLLWALALAPALCAAPVEAAAVVGSAGAIAPTSSAAVPALPALGAVAFPDRWHGWVAGAGVILATADGGATWQAQYNGAQTVQQLDFLDATTGWALGASGLLRTTDGGRRWLAAGDTTPPLKQVQFINANDGWGIAADALYATTDGGATWRAQPTPIAVGDVCFADAQRGWLANANYESAHPTPTTLLRTEDGGADWRAVPLPPGSSDAGITNGGGWFQFLRCPAANVLWDLIVTDAYAGGEGYVLYRTADAGQHWTAVAGNPAAADGSRGVEGPGPVARELVAPTAATAFLLATCGACQGVSTTTIGGTSDGGRTWRNEPPVSGLPWSTGGLTFVDATHGWLAAHWQTSPDATRSAIFATADGGAHWSVQYADPPLAAQAAGMTAGAPRALPDAGGGGTAGWASPPTGSRAALTAPVC